MMLVLSMWVKSLTGSSTQAGFSMVFFMVPQLLAPFVGFVVDRWSRRLILIAGNALSALALVPLFFVHTADDVPIIYAVALVYGISGVILPAASMALQRSIVPDDLLTHAQGLQQTIGNSFQLVAPMVGAGLFAAWGGRGPAAVSLVCFAAATALFAAFRNPPAQERPEENNLLAEMIAGFRHVWRSKPLFDSVVALVLVQCVGGFIQGAMYSVTDTFHKSPEWAGTIVTAQGLGMVVGALLSIRVVRRFGELRAMAAGLVGVGVLALALAAAPTLWAFLALGVAVGLFLPIVFVAAGSLQQRLTPARLMGRVSTATSPLFAIASVASMTAGALLVGVWSFRQIYPVVAVGVLLAAAYLVIADRLRRPRDRVAAVANDDADVAEVLAEREEVGQVGVVNAPQFAPGTQDAAGVGEHP